jgi:hypothetical protein
MSISIPAFDAKNMVTIGDQSILVLGCFDADGAFGGAIGIELGFEDNAINFFGFLGRHLFLEKFCFYCQYGALKKKET